MTRAPFKPIKPRLAGLPKAAVSALVHQAGGIEHVMVKLGIGQSEAYAWTDPKSPKEMSFARVAALTSPECTAGVEYLAQLAGGLFLPMPRAATPIGILTADAVRQHGKAAAGLVEALADNKLSRAEAREALPELEAAARAIALLLSTVSDVANPRAPPPDPEG